MAIFYDFSEKHPAVQLLILIFLMLTGALFSTLFAYAVGFMFWETNTNSIFVDESMLQAQIAFMKFTQFCNQVGMLLLPALIFTWFNGKKSFSLLNMKKSGGLVAICIAVAMTFAISPFISMLQEWNVSIKMPERFRSIEIFLKTIEDQAATLTQIFIETNSTGGLLLNLGLMAVLPAFAEELFFRGVIQNVFQKWIKSNIWAIIITAIIFSGFHFQFYGFFPRFVLGVMLGTLYVLSGSLWVPIVAHFTNNATAVIVGFLEFNGKISITAEEFGRTDHPVWMILSILVVLGLFWLLKVKKGNSLQNVE